MKLNFRIPMLVAMTLSMFVATAQTGGFSYQAVVRNAQGDLVSNGTVALRISLTNQDGAAVQYMETQSVETNAQGVLTAVVGAGKALDGDFANVDWEAGDIWMKVEIDITGGTNYTDLGTTKLQSVPFANYALNGKKGDKGDKGDVGDKGDKGNKASKA